MEFIRIHMEQSLTLAEVLELLSSIPTWLVVSSLLLAGAVLALVICYGIWIYTDAKERTDNPVLWTLLALCFPIVGLVIYLIVGRDKDKKSTHRYLKPVLVAVGSVVAILPFVIGGLFHFANVLISEGLLEVIWYRVW